MTNSKSVVLAIESAISGGSISLLKNGQEIANWVGTSSVSKAEDLLVDIGEILTSTNVSRHDIDLIAVAAGPGSFTGIRIGLATALGLKTGLGIGMSSESALKAMVFASESKGELVAAVPMGRNFVCVQEFVKLDGTVRAVDDPRSLAGDEFSDYVDDHPNKRFILHGSLFERFKSVATITNFGSNIANAIGILCSQQPHILTEPMFISKS